MNLKSVASVIAGKVARPILVTQKHSPTLLFGAGVVGVVATVVLASRATLKLEDVLEKREKQLNDARSLVDEDYSEKDRQQDVAIVYIRTIGEIVKLYGPAVLVGLVSIGALSGAHIILNKRNAGMAAAYAALDKGFREYRKRVVGELGEEKDAEFRYDLQTKEIVEETDEGPVVKTIKTAGPNGPSIYARFFDEMSPSWNPETSYNQLYVNCQLNYLNDLLRSRGHVFLNEAYDLLGIPRSKEGQLVGWVYNSERGDGYISFGVFDNPVEGIRFVKGHNDSILLDFNVDGVVYDLI